eukprot:7583599-Alexandrium_andersonii.AAC.1
MAKYQQLTPRGGITGRKSQDNWTKGTPGPKTAQAVTPNTDLAKCHDQSRPARSRRKRRKRRYKHKATRPPSAHSAAGSHERNALPAPQKEVTTTGMVRTQCVCSCSGTAHANLTFAQRSYRPGWAANCCSSCYDLADFLALDWDGLYRPFVKHCPEDNHRTRVKNHVLVQSF